MSHRPSNIDPSWLRIEFPVPREYAGWRVDLFVANRMQRLSRTRIQKILATAGFDKNGKPLRANDNVASGDLVVLYRPPPDEPDTPRTFDIVYEDEWILGVNKPAGLPMHPTARYYHNTLTSLFKEVYGDARPVIAHRLDAETSGLVMCAKTREAERSLKAAFAERKIQKTYLAMTFGIPDPPQGRIEVPMRLDSRGPIRIKMTCANDGLPSLTEYTVVSQTAERALVECRPRTGRQHQIRVHLAHIGHPVVGDKLYGPDPNVFLDYIAQGPTEEIIGRAGARRHLLHASSVSLVHPVTQAPLVINCPLPRDMTTAMEEAP